MPEWTLPRLRVDRSGDWFDGDVQITHPGILANLRSTLRRDADGYFIETLGLHPNDPDWDLIGRDWVKPREPDARERLYGKLIRRRTTSATAA